MKKGWDRYATEKRYKQKGYLRKYRNGNASWKTPEAGSCDCVQQSREKQEEVVGWVYKNPPEELIKQIQCYGTLVLLTEDVIYTGDEDESKTRIGQPVQSSGEVSSEIRSLKSGSSSSGSRNEKVRKSKDGKTRRSRKKEG